MYISDICTLKAECRPLDGLAYGTTSLDAFIILKRDISQTVVQFDALSSVLSVLLLFCYWYFVLSVK